MPVVDRELVGIGGDLPSPPMTTGNFLKEIIKKNLEDAGDCVWMVCSVSKCFSSCCFTKRIYSLHINSFIKIPFECGFIE
jgi:hypothetical protein